MSGFRDARADLAAKLVAAGVTTATLDPRAVPPCVLVGPATVDGRAGVGGASASIPIHIVAAPPDSDDALAWREEQLDVVYWLVGAQTADVGTYTLAGKDCPAYTLTVPVDVPNPAC